VRAGLCVHTGGRLRRPDPPLLADSRQNTGDPNARPSGAPTKRPRTRPSEQERAECPKHLTAGGNAAMGERHPSCKISSKAGRRER
jgi:hypothetical protein